MSLPALRTTAAHSSTLFVILITSFLLVACNGPTLLFAGGELTGEEAPLSSMKMPAEPVVIQLETRPADPYSVNVGAVPVGSSLYIDPAEGRSWYQYIAENSHVRIKLPHSDLIYTARAIAETDAEILAQFDSERIVMRLDPR